MSIGGISPINTGITPIVKGADGAPGAGSGTSFSDSLLKGLGGVLNQEKQADALTQALASGQPVQIHDVMAATTKAQLSVDLLVQIRNKALDAYREIMNMQV